jgi:zinc protease
MLSTYKNFKEFCMRIFILLLAVLGCTANASAEALIFDTREYTLDNGLKLIVRPDHRAPLVTSQVWYKVGGSYEAGGMTGISHALEHMMFRGTIRYPAGQFAKLIAEAGGQHNAFTSYDFTAYYQQLGAEHLGLCFELEADRMNNLTLASEEYANEINVVLEERRLRIEDNPEAVARERFFAASFINNPRQHPVIGWMGDIMNLRVNDLRQWYKRWYAPNNAILVVVGDVDPDQVFQLAKTHFGALKPVEVPALKPQAEPQPLGTRRITVNLPTESPSLFMGYNVPVILTAKEPWEPYALLVLLLSLDGGNSSRFSEHLIRGKTVAASLSSGYNPYQLLSGQISFCGTPASHQTLEALEQALLTEIEQVRDHPIEQEELQRIKAVAVANHIFQKDSIAHQANEIGSLEAVGLSWQLSENYIDNIKAVTLEQVQAVAKKYLVSERLTITYLLPTNTDNQQ